MPKKNKQQQKRPKKRSARSAQRKRLNELPGVVPVISKCGKDYLAALTNPFKSISPPPCIPDVISLPSNKYRTRTTGTLETNGTGQAQIGVSPYRTSVNDDTSAISYSTGTFTPGGVDDFNFAVGTVGVALQSMAGPYSTAQLNLPAVQMRLVGCGVKIRYAGPELLRAGRLVIFRAPANIGLQNGTVSSLMAIPSSRKAVVKKEWTSVCYLPDDPDFLGYQGIPALNIASNTNLKVLIICITGAPANTTFDFEVSAYWEMLGSINANIYGNYTKSHSDTTALGAAISAIPVKISDKPPEQQERKGLFDLGQNILNTVSHIAYIKGSNILNELAGSYMPQQMQQKQLAYGPSVEDVD